MGDDEEDVEIAWHALDDGTMEGIGDFAASVVRKCLDHGMEVPLNLVAIDINGNILRMRYVWNETHDDLETDPHTVKFTEGPFQPPVNFMVVDAKGGMGTFRIDPDGIQYLQ